MSELENERYDDEIDLFELFQTLWDSKGLIAGVTGLAGAIGVIAALMMPQQYVVDAKIAPASSDGGGGASALLSQYGGLASLAGISLPSGGGSDSDLLLEIMQSRAFIGEFIEKHDLAARLIAVKGFDAQTQTETFDRAIYDPKTNEWSDAPPSLLGLIGVFEGALQINSGKGSSVIELSFEHPSPLLGQEVLTALIEDIDTYARDRDEQSAQQSIDYLQRQLGQTRLVEVQRVLYEMIESQTKTLMLAEVNQDYAFQIIDPAMQPDSPAKPKRTLIVALALVLGGMIAVIGVLIRSAIRNRRDAQASS